MENNQQEVFFSVIIPTRNRPQLFKLALDSVLAQSFDNFEVIVVNDGSTEEYWNDYEDLKEQTGDKVSFHELVHRPNGHGQSYSMNYGVSKSRGKYICFLDDDDYWIDTEHLIRAYNSIIKSNKPVDVYYTNQVAYYSDGTKKIESVWIEDLKEFVENRKYDDSGSYLVDVPFLLKSGGFAHLNCSIIRKELYQSIGGMDENIRYECDRDFYIRSIDFSKIILHNPAIISKHNIPDAKKKDNMSTLVSFSEKLIYQMRVYDKGIALSKNELIVDYCAVGKMYILKKMAEGFFNKKDFKKGYVYSRQALGIRITLKWLLFTSYLYFKYVTRRGK